MYTVRPARPCGGNDGPLQFDTVSMFDGTPFATAPR